MKAEPTQIESIALVAEQSRQLAAIRQFSKALAVVETALVNNPRDPELLFARGCALFDWGRVREARDAFLAAESGGLVRLSLHLNLSWTSSLLGDPAIAERYVRQAIALVPDSVDAHFALGTILRGLRRLPEAVAAFEAALALAPRNAQCLTNLGACKCDLGEYQAAEAFARRALALEPSRPSALANLGIALSMRHRYAEGLAALRSAAQQEEAMRGDGESFVNFGYGLILNGRVHEAIAFHRRNLPFVPNPSAHRQYAFALLEAGSFREGWEQHEFRWLVEPALSRRPRFAKPPWVGQPLAGRTLLLRAEQGAGDIIQFARYSSDLKARGATVLLEVPDELTALAQGFRGVDRVVRRSDASLAFDFYAHLMSLPHFLGTTIDSVPADVPYLAVDAAKLSQWCEPVTGPGLKIGLAWAGNPAHMRDRNRSIPLATLAPLLAVDGVRFYSLQKQPRPGEAELYPPPPRMQDLGPDLADFGDTAAAIAQLDLVICVDTAVAHLAGALGKPTWLMLPKVGDFRWLASGETSPWYPSMRLFRQTEPDVWDDVVQRVTRALADAVADGRVPPPPAGTLSLQQGDEPKDPPHGIARVIEVRHGIVQYLPGVDDAARSLEYYGEYMQAHVDLIATLLPPSSTAIEVGSGVGAHALALARLTGAAGHLVLFEGDPITQRMLRQNLEANRVGARTTVMRQGLTSGDDLTCHGDATIDGLHLDALDLIKIRDCVDALSILRGASATLARTRPVIFTEISDEARLTGLAAYLAAQGYRCWQSTLPLFDPANFLRREDDVFRGQTVTALAALPQELLRAVTSPAYVPVAVAGGADREEGDEAQTVRSGGGIGGLLRRKLGRTRATAPATGAAAVGPAPSDHARAVFGRCRGALAARAGGFASCLGTGSGGARRAARRARPRSTPPRASPSVGTRMPRDRRGRGRGPLAAGSGTGRAGRCAGVPDARGDAAGEGAPRRGRRLL